MSSGKDSIDLLIGFRKIEFFFFFFLVRLWDSKIVGRAGLEV